MPAPEPRALVHPAAARRRAALLILAALLGALLPLAFATPAHAAFSTIVVDEGGDDDASQQRDLTLFSVDDAPAPGTVRVLFHLEPLGLNGANTADACNLFDTDQDSRADYALCVSLTSTGGTFSGLTATAYSCNDTSVTNCRSAVAIPLGGSSCTFTTGDDPFEPGVDALDTAVTCTIQLAAFGGGAAVLVNTCAYSSDSLESNTADCVRIPRSAFIRIIKQATPDDGTPFPFTVTGPLSFSESRTITGSGTAGDIGIVPGNSYALAESVPAGWALTGASCTGGTSNGTSTATGVTGITAAEGAVVTCTVTDVKGFAGELTVTKTPSPGSVPETGGSVVFTVTVENDSPTGAASLTALSDDVFGTVTQVQGDVTATTCTVPQPLAASNGVAGSGPDFYSCSFTADVGPGNVGADHENIVTATVSGFTDTASATVTFTDTAPTVSVDKSADPSSVAEPGGSVTYTVVVTNTSAEPVTVTELDDSFDGGADVSIIDPADCVPVADPVQSLSLAPGATYTCSYTAASPVDAGVYTNTVTVTVADDEGTTGTDSDDAAVTVTDTAPTVSVDKSVSPSSVAEPGGSVTYTVVVTNTSAEPVDITALSDDFNGQGAVSILADTDCVPVADPVQSLSLAPGATYTCSYTAASPADAGVYTNTVTVTVADDEGTTGTDSDDATVTVTDTAPTVSVDKSVSPSSVAEPGGSVTYTVVVTNTSAEPVTVTELDDSFDGGADVSIIDPADCVPVADPVQSLSLAPGATYTCSYTAASPADAGVYTNTVTVTVADDEGTTGTDSDDAAVTVTDTAPTVSVDKSVSPSSVAEPGGSVTYTVVVTNTSAEPVDITALSDDFNGQGAVSILADTDCVPVADPVQSLSLAPGATYTCSYTAASPADAGVYTNTVTVTVADDEGTTGTDSDDATVTVTDTAPTVSVDKSVSPSSVAEPGGTVTYTVVVTNTSAEPVDITALSDDFNGQGAVSILADTDCVPVADPVQSLSLAPGATYTCSYTAASPADAGVYTNTVTVTVADDEGSTGTDSDDATVTVTDTAPTVSVDKSADPSSVAEPGGSVTYTVVVTNTSAEPVTVTELDDDFDGQGAVSILADTDCVPVADPVQSLSLAPGATYTCSYTAASPADAGVYTNTVTVTVADDEGSTGTDSDDAAVTVTDTAPTVSVDKSVSPSSVAEPGGSVTYTVVVTNTSAEPVDITALSDDFDGQGAVSILADTDCVPVADPVQSLSLAPGATYTCSYTAASPADAGVYTNTVTVTVADDEGTTGTDSDDAAVTVTDVTPVIEVVKSVTPASRVVPGGLFTYTVEVTNTSTFESVGLLELTDLVGEEELQPFGLLADPALEGGESPCYQGQELQGSIEIGPGETFTCTFVVEFTGEAGDTHIDRVTAVATDFDSGGEGEGDRSAFAQVAPPITATSNTVTVTLTAAPTPPPPPPPPASADLGIAKVADPTEASVGEPADFVLTVTNAGPSSASSVTVTDTVPDGLAIDGVTTDQGSCTIAAQVVTCALGTLPAGATGTVTITVIPEAAGSYDNVAAVDSPTADPDPTDDSATATLDVIELPPAQICEPFDEGITRLEGITRIETAIAGSQAVFCDLDATAVVLTRSDLFPDAQAGTPLAIALDAPLLLSEPQSLNPATEEEILRVLQPGGTVYLLGGEVALSQAVADRIAELGFQVIRYGGENRFGTAAIIADEGLDGPGTVLLADGGDFPASVVAGAASLAAGGGTGMAAVLLTSGADIPPETQAYLDAQQPTPTLVAIGEAARQAFPDVEGVGGADRFEMSVAVAERFFDAPQIVGVATGADFADALTGGAVIGRSDVGPGPMLLVDGQALTPVTTEYLQANADSIVAAVIFGGEVAISLEVEEDVASFLAFTP